MADLNPRLLRLVADMLRAYAARVSNDTCTDWDPPAYLTFDDRLDLARAVREANGHPLSVEPHEDVRDNWIAALALVHLIRSAGYLLDDGGE